MNRIFFLLTFLFSIAFTHSIYAQYSIITTIAGIDSEGYNGDYIPAVDSKLYLPISVAISSKNEVYISDRDNNRIRKIDTNGIITTYAGTGLAHFNGDTIQATMANIAQPYGICIDDTGTIFFSDCNNQRIRKVTTDGIIHNVAGNGVVGYNGDNIAATDAEIDYPEDVAVDKKGNFYIPDGTNRIRKVDANGIITTIAGNGTAGFSGDSGPATAALIHGPYGITTDQYSNVFFSDNGNYRIRKIDTNGIITTVAGNGSAGYNGDSMMATDEGIVPNCLCVDNAGNIYFADSHNSFARMVTNTGIMYTIAGIGANGFGGDGGPPKNAAFNVPNSAKIDKNGNLYITDFGNSRIRFIKNTTGINKINDPTAKVEIYPVPSIDGKVNIKIITAVEQVIQADLINILGQNIQNLKLYSNQLQTINIKESGIYILQVKINDFINNYKIQIL